MRNNVRNSTLDVAKGLGIWLVLIGHAALFGNQQLAKYIYAFHMPFFFMISGFFYKPKTIKETIKSNFNRLIIPYLIIGFSCAVPAVIFGHTTSAMDFLRQAAGTVYSVPRSDWTFYCTPIWFLTCLFCVEAIYSTLRDINTQIKHLVVLSLFGIGVLAFSYFGSVLSPWNVLTALLGMFFYHFGATLRAAGFFSGNESISRTAISVIPTAALFWYGAQNSTAFVNVSAGTTGNVFYFLIASISGSLLAFQTATLLRSFWPLKIFGRNTIILFGYNYWVMALGNNLALSTHGWLASFAIQVPFYFALCWLSEKNRYVSFAIKRTPLNNQPSNRVTN